MKSWTVMMLAAALAAGGCASAHQLAVPVAQMQRLGVIDDPKQAARLEKAMTDSEIANLLDLDVRAKLPTALAVARLASYCGRYQPYLDRLDATELETWEKISAKHRSILGVQPVTNLTFNDARDNQPVTLRELRMAAARLHCELLLVYLEANSSVNNFNDAAALYWTFVGLWLVPGNVVEHKTVMQAILVDCRTGTIMGTAGGDSHLKRIVPAALMSIQTGKLSKQAPAEALADLQKGCDKLLLSVVSRAMAKSQ